ncbi:glutamine-hydrolyzing carbamoyl-phosphate synthase small subunit [Parvularcula flava]|uniref:Carbamoyl phosphate synthase small chain n=1 Tax=Aquisalinus luteolus TaxID=1566827 RepID=A0A8J3A4Z9_9PROT|nr:glutamine-hydrolyzing carbamoyl-phosphate synthase small subunit [Aquisalinus luteolus]NHK28819.1 glutamine-hydrolyzing carbamoyl-phosphate synthase small subunit [Aquisalinus luteolus]GGH99612.1 carbamoyl-phosphate synthase small chain [Aquisalinus luteolus]
MRISQDSVRSTFPTGILVLADGTVFEGEGFGATGSTVGEVCFNTAITGYQEILTDPSYAAQIITFTFPHIGNVGANDEDIENASPAAATAARGAIFRDRITAPSNYRARLDLSAWMKRRGIIGLAGIDTRALTAMIRENGMPHGVIAHSASGNFDVDALQKKAAAWPGLEGLDLAKEVTTLQSYPHDETGWVWGSGYGKQDDPNAPHVVVIDYGVKRNILRRLATAGFRISVVNGQSSFDDIMALKPDGVVLSNGPGDPAATGTYAVPVIKQLIEAKVPTLGICLGHQLLALAVGAKTKKMVQGHHGANHPVKDNTTGKVEIVSMNHGFTVDETTLPDNCIATHTSLFDGSNSGIALKNAPAFSVQHHPEASPGPQDSFYLFKRFRELIGGEDKAA